MMLNAEARDQLRTAAFAVPAAILMAATFAVPLGAIFVYSFLAPDGSRFSFETYQKVLSTPILYRVAYTTIEISLGATLFSFILAYPVAYFLAKQTPRRRAVLMILVLIPFWTSSLVKSFAMVIILGQSGLINQFLGQFGIGPIKMLFNRFGVMVGMSHYLIPFMVFPILTSLLSQPHELARAAAMMGAGKVRIFLKVTFPLSLPGVMAGSLLVFILSLGFYVIPALLGGRQDLMLANLVDFYAREILNWPMASTVAMFLVASALIASILLSKVRGGSSVLSEGNQ